MTHSDREVLIRDLFLRAVDLAEPARSTLLDKACREDLPLRARVEALLAADAIPEPYVPLPPPRPSSESRIHPGGGRFGRFVLRGILGEGGMGVVYLAEQEHPRREVALKILRGIMHSKGALHRFASEVDLQARLNHPGIARLYEAGAEQTPHGEIPYFVMEPVDGRGILEYCQVKSLGTNPKLNLIAEIADAIEHAHHSGVIHRDLKPQNIMVTDDGQPKVLDFGIGRSTEAKEGASRTKTGQIVGTLAYMSPEQCAGQRSAIDIRTDIYSLGAVAYELLTGQPALRLDGCALDEAVHKIRHDEPRLLGTRVRALRGEIEAIIAKAIAKEPDHRYQSASAFASDIRRFLRHEPVTAVHPTRRYRLSKFVSRYRGAVAVSLVIFGLLTTGLVTASVLAFSRAEEIETQLAIRTFLEDMLRAANPREHGEDYPVRDLVLAAARSFDDQFEGKPRIEAEIREILGGTLMSLGDFIEGEAQLRGAIELRRRVGGPWKRATIDLKRKLGNALHARGQTEEAEATLRDCLHTSRMERGHDDPVTLRVAFDLAGVVSASRRGTDEPLQLLRDTLVRQQRVLGSLNCDTIRTKARIAWILGNAKGETETAAEMMRQVVEESGEIDEIHAIDRMTYESFLAQIIGKEDPQEAARIYQSVVERRAKLLPPDHPTLAVNRMNLGSYFARSGLFDQAEIEYRSALPTLIDKLGITHPKTRVTLLNLNDLTHDRYGAEAAADFRFEWAPRLDTTPWAGQTQAETSILIPPFPESKGHFGSLVASSDGWLAVSAPFEDAGEEDTGTVYLYRGTEADWTLATVLRSNRAAAKSYFGRSMALSDDHLAIGEFSDCGEPGIVNCYRRIGSEWVLESVITAPQATNTREFPGVLQIEGEVLAVGQTSFTDESGNATGAVHIFRLSDDSWEYEATLAPGDGAESCQFGSSIAMHEDRLAIGAPGYDSPDENAGLAYLYRFDGESWVLERCLSQPDSVDGQNFGRSIAIDGDSILVGASGDREHGANAGAAYVFRLSNARQDPAVKLAASDIAAHDSFGSTVVLSQGLAIVLAPRENQSGLESGAVYVFREFGGNWKEDSKLVVDRPDWITGFHSIAVNGDTVVSGANHVDSGAIDAGAAYFHRLRR